MCHCGAVTALDANGFCDDCSTAYDEAERSAVHRAYQLRPVPLVEHDATELFRDESPDWRFCLEHGAFSHREACEFLLHVPKSGVDLAYREDELRAFGCSDGLVALLRGAHAVGAVWLLLYA
jgi:hypothetical protein